LLLYPFLPYGNCWDYETDGFLVSRSTSNIFKQQVVNATGNLEDHPVHAVKREMRCLADVAVATILDFRKCLSHWLNLRCVSCFGFEHLVEA